MSTAHVMTDAEFADLQQRAKNEDDRDKKSILVRKCIAEQKRRDAAKQKAEEAVEREATPPKTASAADQTEQESYKNAVAYLAENHAYDLPQIRETAKRLRVDIFDLKRDVLKELKKRQAEAKRDTSQTEQAKASTAERQANPDYPNEPMSNEGENVGEVVNLNREKRQPWERNPQDPGPRPNGSAHPMPGSPAESVNIRAEQIKFTPFILPDLATIPRREWVYGKHLIRKQVSVTVAPGGLGKSSLAIAEALAMASGKPLLSEWVDPAGVTVCLFNLEDDRDELTRRIGAAMDHYGITQEDIAGKLFVDTGREQELCTAIQGRNGIIVRKPVFDNLAEQTQAQGIDVLIVDPFVSSHNVSENDNGAIDTVTKAWARLANESNIAIELIHHTRKTNGEEATTESARGASAMLNTARSGRVLNRMTDQEKASAGIEDDDYNTYFSVTRDKANLAPTEKRNWYRTVSTILPNSDDEHPGDSVVVVEPWHWPDAFKGVTANDTLKVQQAIQQKTDAGEYPRKDIRSEQHWVGCIVADVLDLDTDKEADKTKIKKLISTWLETGVLKEVSKTDQHRKKKPCVMVDEWINHTPSD